MEAVVSLYSPLLRAAGVEGNARLLREKLGVGEAMNFVRVLFQKSSRRPEVVSWNLWVQEA